MRKFLVAESFVVIAKHSYQRMRRDCLELSSVSSLRSRLQSERKRGKISSGPEVTPATSLAQPSKQSTGGVPQRRLAFSLCEILEYVV